MSLRLPWHRSIRWRWRWPRWVQWRPRRSLTLLIQHGVASWYGERFQNKRTANGERFNMNALTAAHPTLPFGTKLCAHSPATGKSVIVRINDRGPFVKDRIIDFSKAAAQALGILHAKPGVVALLDSSDERCEKG